MTGATQYTANAVLNHISGGIQMFPLPSVYMGLFTAVGTDIGIGFTEPFGNGYIRVQVSGNALCSGSTAAGTGMSGTGILSFGTVPGWLAADMYVYDVTTLSALPANTRVVSFTTTTVTVDKPIGGGGVNDGDQIVFTAFNPAASSGSAGLCSISNSAGIQFALASGSWGAVIAWGLFDQIAAGNLMEWDYLGPYDWVPVEISNGSPAVLTASGHGYSLNDSFVYSIEYGGTLPTFAAGTLTGVLTVQAPVTADTFTVKNGATVVNTSSSGSGMVRKIISQNVTAGQAPFFTGGNPGGLILSFA